MSSSGITENRLKNKVKQVLVEGKHWDGSMDWYTFFQPMTPTLELYYEDLSAEWVTDIMLCLLERQRPQSKYVSHFTIHHKRLADPDSFQATQRFTGSYDYLKHTQFIFQVTFTQDGKDRICVVVINKESSVDRAFVFFPFPEYYLANPKSDVSMGQVLDYIRKEWQTANKKQIHVEGYFKFCAGFKGSNIYAVYFLALMQSHSSEDVRRLFQQDEMRLLTRHKALSIYRTIGKLISKCVSGQKNTDALRAHAEYMGPGAKHSLPMNQHNFILIRQWLGVCSPVTLQNLIPLIPRRSIEDDIKRYPGLAERMVNFLPEKPGGLVGEMKIYV